MARILDRRGEQCFVDGKAILINLEDVSLALEGTACVTYISTLVDKVLLEPEKYGQRYRSRQERHDKQASWKKVMYTVAL